MHRKAIRHLKSSDPVMARLIEQVGSCVFETRDDGKHFDHVARAIVYQQLSGSAASTIFRRFTELYGGRVPAPAELLATPEERLRSVGLSRQKIGYLLDLARKAESGEVDFDSLHTLDDAMIVERLTKVKGVGVWTAQMFLMFRLGRPDVLPDLDLGIRKGIQRAYRLRKEPNAARVHEIGKSWAPYRTIACWYLWRSLDVAGASKTPPEKRQGGAPRAKRARSNGKR
jgi:DNA-3-methyladenine glycosylase II